MHSSLERKPDTAVHLDDVGDDLTTRLSGPRERVARKARLGIRGGPRDEQKPISCEGRVCKPALNRRKRTEWSTELLARGHMCMAGETLLKAGIHVLTLSAPCSADEAVEAFIGHMRAEAAKRSAEQAAPDVPRA